MDTTAPRSDSALRVVGVLPVVFLVHQLEEWFGGLPDWARSTLGADLTEGQFIGINAIGLAIATLVTILALWERRLTLPVVAFATLIGLNGLLHLLATAVFGRYSPGVVTGVLLSLPVGVVILKSAVDRLSRGGFIGAVVTGIVLHAGVSAMALA